MGAASIPMGIAKATEFLKQDCNVIDVVDRDIYGRESLIRIEKC